MRSTTEKSVWHSEGSLPVCISMNLAAFQSQNEVWTQAAFLSSSFC